jgi:hypothetical protein
MGGYTRPRVERLQPQQLLRLLEIYDAAIPELRAIGDPGVQSLIERLSRRHAETLAAIAEQNGKAIAAIRTF